MLNAGIVIHHIAIMLKINIIADKYIFCHSLHEVAIHPHMNMQWALITYIKNLFDYYSNVTS